MSEIFTFRRAVRDDLTEILSIMDSAVSATADRDWFVPDDRAFFERHLEERGFILAAETFKGQMAAYLAVRFPAEDDDNLGRDLGLSPDELRYVAHIESTAVSPVFFGNRLQSRLVCEAERYLKAPGFIHLMATVHPDNHYSLNSMLRQGYRIAATKQKYGGLRRHILYKHLQPS